MLVIGIILSFFGLGFLICLVFTLAVYALPFFAAVTVGMAALHSGAGVIGAILAGAFAGGATLATGRIAFTMVRAPTIRAAIALLYAVPATIAGYSATHGLAELTMPSSTWQMIFALIGAVCVGCTDWARLAMQVPAGFKDGFLASPATPQFPGGTRGR